MPKSPSQQLLAWINEQLAVLPPGAALPTDKQLSERFDVSRRTIARLYKKFVSEGKLIRVSGKGTFIPSSDGAAEASEPAQARTSTQALVDTVRGLIQTGELKRGHSLPSIKYMRRRFKVSPLTITKAYQQLSDEGYVTRTGKTFWVGRFRELIHPESKKDIYLFLHNSTDFSRIFKEDRLAQSYCKLQSELGYYGFVLRCESTPNLEALISGWIRKRRTPYGCIFYGIDLKNCQEIFPHINRLIADKNTETPPIIIDWITGMPPPFPKGAHILSRPNMQTAMARALAHYLVERGWKGVEVYTDAKMLAPSPSLWINYDWLRLRAELKNLDKNFAFRIIVKVDREIHPENQTHSWVSDAIATRILSKYEYTPYASVKDDIFAETDDFKKEFMRAPNRTMLVFRCDMHAAFALEWLNQHSKRIPKDIGIMGVENDPAYYQLGISCCDVDTESIGYLMAHAIIGDFAVKKTHKGFMRVPADISERLTT